MNAVRIAHRRPPDHSVVGRWLFRRRTRHLQQIGAMLAVGQVSGLRLQRFPRFLIDFNQRGAGGGAHHGRQQSLHQGCGTDHDPFGKVTVQELDRQLGAEQRAAEIEQHEHTIGRINRGDRQSDRRSIGPETAIVHAGGHRNSGCIRRDHLLGQGHYVVGQRTAVRDDNDSDHASVLAAATSSRVALVAPGSATPALRWPR